MSSSKSGDLYINQHLPSYLIELLFVFNESKVIPFNADNVFRFGLFQNVNFRMKATVLKNNRDQVFEIINMTTAF